MAPTTAIPATPRASQGLAVATVTTTEVAVTAIVTLCSSDICFLEKTRNTENGHLDNPERKEGGKSFQKEVYLGHYENLDGNENKNIENNSYN